MAMTPKLAALVAEAKRKHQEKQNQALSSTSSNSATASTAATREALTQNVNVLHLKQQAPVVHSVLTSAANSFQPTIGVSLNEKQTEAVELAMRGKSFNLIGAAGTGKTTTTREIIGQLARLSHITPIQKSTKHLSTGAPGIVIISFTNKAVNNIKKFLPAELQKHCLTYHKLLEYAPVQYLDEPNNPFGKKTMRFEPTYNEEENLPHISCVIVEESSMVSAMKGDIHDNLLKALPNPKDTQFIFLGDLNQLPPIFGPSILGFKLLDLPTVELTHVYRQALESPIITLAHKIREGRGFSMLGKLTLGEDQLVDDRGEHGKVTVKPWKKRIEPGPACKVLLHNFLIPLVTQDGYDFTENVILCPFNKSFGTIELNKTIADALGKKRNAEVFEVVARGNRTYWAVGDRVLVDRREAVILRIEPTPGYAGAIPEPASKTLDRWGRDSQAQQHAGSVDKAIKLAAAIETLESMRLGDDAEERKNAASHTITVEFVDSGTTESLSSAGDINSMLFSYVLTVHKSQGSEWKRVFILLHYSHNTMLTRELLYTAVTRAKHELFIICEPDRKEIYNSITRASKSPEIQGVTLAEKALYFQNKKKTMKSLESAESRKKVAMEAEDIDCGEEM